MSHLYLSRRELTQPYGAPYQAPTREAAGQNVMFSLKKLQHINCIQQPTHHEGSLYLGDIISIIKPDIIHNHGISAVLSCLSETNYSSNLPSHVVRKIIAARDTMDYPLNLHFDEAFQFIQNMRKKKKNILVHCHAGVSRSATIICAYLMRKKQWSMGHTLSFLREKRNRVKPNQNFLKLLEAYELNRPIKATQQSRLQRSSANYTAQRNSFDSRPERRLFGPIENQIRPRDSRSMHRSNQKIRSFQSSTTSIRYSMKIEPEGGLIQIGGKKKQNNLKIKKPENKEVSFGQQFKNKISALLGRKTRIPWQLTQNTNIEFEENKFSIGCI